MVIMAGNIIVLILIILANVKDFVRLFKGAANEYLQANSGMLYSLVGLLWFVMDVDKKYLFISIFILWGVYIATYTWIFFKIKKYKEERDKEDVE